MGDSQILDPLRIADFRWLVLGAFVSFIGSQIQNISLGFYVYQLTGDKAKLGLVYTLTSLPFLLFGPIVGALADVWNKRLCMNICMIGMGLFAAYLGYASQHHFLTFEQILVASFLSGCLQTLEAPSRQCIVRQVVPASMMSQAIPFQAMAFNMSRVVGPAIGGIAAEVWGTTACFYINAVSFLALVGSMILIKADLGSTTKDHQPIKDLVVEGIRYTFRHDALRTLFWMESATSLLGVWYLTQMPAIAKSMLGLGASGLGIASSFVGFGAIGALVTLAIHSKKPYKPLLVRASMTLFSVMLICLGFVHTALLAYPIFLITGFATVMQFNTTNTLFQLMAPPQMRGRVLSMHFWAISGASTVGTLIFGWLAQRASLPVALWVGGTLLGLVSIAAHYHRSKVYEPIPEV